MTAPTQASAGGWGSDQVQPPPTSGSPRAAPDARVARISTMTVAPKAKVRAVRAEAGSAPKARAVPSSSHAATPANGDHITSASESMRLPLASTKRAACTSPP